jgi:hypothetical protein
MEAIDACIAQETTLPWFFTGVRTPSFSQLTVFGRFIVVATAKPSIRTRTKLRKLLSLF